MLVISIVYISEEGKVKTICYKSLIIEHFKNHLVQRDKGGSFLILNEERLNKDEGV